MVGVHEHGLPAGGVLGLLAWAYTAGPYPMVYCGTADVVVLVMFGPVAVSRDHLCRRWFNG